MLLVPVFSRADSFAPLGEQLFASPSGKYVLLTVPPNSKLPSNLREAAQTDEQRQEIELLQSCHAILFVAARVPIWRWKLVNQFGPMQAFVSDDGRYVVALDEYANGGYGDNVLVIYKEAGELVRRFKLTELLSAKEIEETPRSISSILWHRGIAQIDTKADLFVLKLRDRTLRVQLATGEILKEEKPAK